MVHQQHNGQLFTANQPAKGVHGDRVYQQSRLTHTDRHHSHIFKRRQLLSGANGSFTSEDSTVLPSQHADAGQGPVFNQYNICDPTNNATTNTVELNLLTSTNINTVMTPQPLQNFPVVPYGQPPTAAQFPDQYAAQYPQYVDPVHFTAQYPYDQNYQFNQAQHGEPFSVIADNSLYLLLHSSGFFELSAKSSDMSHTLYVEKIYTNFGASNVMLNANISNTIAFLQAKVALSSNNLASIAASLPVVTSFTAQPLLATEIQPVLEERMAKMLVTCG